MKENKTKTNKQNKTKQNKTKQNKTNKQTNRNVQIGVDALSKLVLKNIFFVKKLKISCSFNHTNLFKFYLHVVQTFCKEWMERLWTFNVSINNGSTEEF